MEATKTINNILRLENISASIAIEHKHELESAGLILNKDFEWKWNSPTTDFARSTSSWVEFTFTNPAHATFYKLRWE